MKSVLLSSLQKSQYSLFLQESREIEFSLYCNLWCLGFIRLNGRLMDLDGGLAIIINIYSFDCSRFYFPKLKIYKISLFWRLVFIGAIF